MKVSLPAPLFHSVDCYPCLALRGPCIVLPTIADDRLWVIGGQHITSALLKMRKEFLNGGKGLPEWLKSVECEELHHDCPIAARELISGDHNALQHSTSPMRMPQVVERLHMELSEQEPPSQKEAVMLALRKCGRFHQYKSKVCYQTPSKGAYFVPFFM